MPTVTEDWLGLVLYSDKHACIRCKKPVLVHTLAVTDNEGQPHHVRCAVHLGWVPSDTEAMTLAFYNTASEEVQ